MSRITFIIDEFSNFFENIFYEIFYEKICCTLLFIFIYKIISYISVIDI